jgi:predicted GNAT superfamily acetyltransferase
MKKLNSSIRRVAGYIAREFAEHAEFYALFLLGIVTLTVHTFGWADSDRVIDLLLVALMIFTFAMLRFLHGLRERDRPRLDEVLLDEYPDSYFNDLSRAKDLWMTGTNLRRIFPDHTGLLEKVLSDGGHITALLAKPGTDACKYGTLQEYGYVTERMERSFSELVETALRTLEQLKESAPGRVTVLKVDFPIYFAIDAVNVNLLDGVIYLRFYPIAAKDRPIVVLRPYESRWFDFYKQQLLALIGEINPATVGHVSAIATLAKKVELSPFSEERHPTGFLIPYTEDEYRKFAVHAEHFYVLSSGDKFAGFALAHTSSILALFGEEEVYDHIAKSRRKPFILVRQICVDPNYSNRGYGRRLYEYLFEQIRRANQGEKTAVAFIWESPPNQASENFHRATGWSKVETYPLKKGRRIVGIWERKLS